MPNKICKYMLLSLLFINALFGAMPTENALTYGIAGDALYSWERSGFMIGDQAVELSDNERLVENPQVLEMESELYLLVHAIRPNNSQWVYKVPFAGGDFILTAPQSNPGRLSLQEFFSEAIELVEPKLIPSSVLGRLPVFYLSAEIVKKYGDLFHFAEDDASPEIKMEAYTYVFSPNEDGILDEAHNVYKIFDDRSDFAIDVLAEIISTPSRETVYSELLRPYTMMSVTMNHYWNGKNNAGETAKEGWYYLKISGTDESGNPAHSISDDFYLKTTPPILESFIYSISGESYKNIITKESEYMLFTLAITDAPVMFGNTKYQIKLAKKEDPYFSYSISGIVSGSPMNKAWFIGDDYGRPLKDGFYTAECQLIDDVGLASRKVSFNFEINREPIYIEIEKNDNIFTPHNTGDTFPDTAEFTITLRDRGVTVSAPYSYQILSEQGELIIRRDNYASDKITWDGKNAQGNFLADGLYTLKVNTLDEVGNAFEKIEKIIKTRIPVSLTPPKTELKGNMVPIIGTVNDPGGTTQMDFTRFEIFAIPSGNVVFPPDLTKWQKIEPLPYYMDSATENFPSADYGIRTGYGAKLAFWRPTENGAYTVVLRSQDAEGYAGIAAMTVTVDFAVGDIEVPRVAPLGDTALNINNDDFTALTQWDTRRFNNLVSYEVNIYAVSGDRKTEIIRNYAKTGNPPNAALAILWDGKDQWRNYVASGTYIMEIIFYDLLENVTARQEVQLEINNYYDSPLVIDRYELVDEKKIFLELNKPASYNITVYNGQNPVADFSGSELAAEYDLPELPAGFYRINLDAESSSNPEDKKSASITLVLNQEMSKDGAEIFLPTGNIEPQHYFAFEAERGGTFYPEITGNVTLKINGLREKYPYDPYTLMVRYSAAEMFWIWTDRNASDGINIGDGSRDDGYISFFSQFPQEIYVTRRDDPDGSVARDWRNTQPGKFQIGEGYIERTFHGSTSKSTFGDNSLVMEANVYHKTRQEHTHEIEKFWKNTTENSLSYDTEPDFAQLQTDLLARLDNFYLQRGMKKNVLISMQSDRPYYEKNTEKTWYHDLCGQWLEHFGEPTIHHDWGISQQIEYDEEEFIKTNVMAQEKSATPVQDELKGKDRTIDTMRGINFTTVNILVDNFAEPQMEPFEFEITIPLKALYKGNDFYSGDLAAFAEEVLGEGSQLLQIPYRVSGDLRYFPVEMPISTNTTVYSAEIISVNVAEVRNIQTVITHVAGYPQLLATTDYAVPWTPAMDANLKAGKLRGVAVYDPLNNSQIKLADYYPQDGINRNTSMFHVKDGAVTLNPQVALNDDYTISLREVRELGVSHSALSAEKIYYSESNKAEDYFSVKLDALAYIDAYLPVYGWIADGYKENGYALYIREADNANWTEDSFNSDYFPAEYRMRTLSNGYLLGFVNISDCNSDNTVRLVSSGAKGTSETFGNIALGRKVIQGQQSRIYAYDYRVWLDIYADSLITPNTYYVTLTPQKYDKDKMSLPDAMADPFGPIYSMRPHGLRFNPDSQPILTSILNNSADEDIDLSRLVVYHLDKNNVLNLAQMYSVTDGNNDGFLQPQETGSMASFVEGFSKQFYVPALQKINFDNYEIYSGSEEVIINAYGSPTGNLRGYLDSDYLTPIVDQAPDTASGDYKIVLNITEGAHKFEAREYQIIGSAESVGPLSDAVNIIVDLVDPEFELIQVSNTSNMLELEYKSSEKAVLTAAVSENIYTYSAVKGLNQQKIIFTDLADGLYTATLNLTDLSGRTSNAFAISVLQDTAAPGTEIVSPESGQSAASRMTLRYTAPTEDLRVFAAEYTLSGNIWAHLTDLETSATAKELYIPDNHDVTVSLRLKAVDLAGNEFYSPSVDIRIDNNYMYRLNESAMTPIVSANKVTGLVLDANFAEYDTELFFLKNPTDLTDLLPVSNSVTIDIDFEEPVIYLIGRKYTLFANIIPVPVQLPHFTKPLYRGDIPKIDWPLAGAITYAEQDNRADVYYQPLGSSLIYLADSAEIRDVPKLEIAGVDSDEALLYTDDGANYRYKPITGNSITVRYDVSAPVTRSLSVAFADTALTIPVKGSYAQTIELQNIVTLSAVLENANSINIVFTPDLVCYAPQEISCVNSENIISWSDPQTDISRYALRLYLHDALILQEDTDRQNISLTGLQENTFYRLELNAFDQLGNVSATKSITFYSSPGKLFTVRPLEFAQFAEKMAGINFPINTYSEEVIYAYKEYAPQVITGDIYLYQAFDLLPSKILTANQPIDFYFSLNQLSKTLGGDRNTLGLYYFKDGIWQAVPAQDVDYDREYQKYSYAGAQFYPLAIGARRFAQWVVEGVSENYTAGAVDIDLSVYALNADSERVTSAVMVKIISANVLTLQDNIYTNAQGYGVLPIQLTQGREVTYSLTVMDETGVTGGIVFYAEKIPITFNALVIDGWQRITESAELKEGAQYLLDIDVSSYAGAKLNYAVAGGVTMNLGAKPQFLYRPDYLSAGTRHLDISVKDGENSIQTYRITMNIENTNRLPYIDNNEIIEVTEQEDPPRLGIFTIADWDEDDSVEEIQFVDLPPYLDLRQDDEKKALIRYELCPTWNQQGTHNITARIFDGKDWAEEKIIIFVKNNNRIPEIMNRQTIYALENQLVTYSLRIRDEDEETVNIDFAEFPFPAGVIASRNIDSRTAEFDVWVRPGFVEQTVNECVLLMDDTSDIIRTFQRIEVKPDLIAPAVSPVGTPAASTYALWYDYLFTVRDNVWTTIDIKVYRDSELIMTAQETTENITLNVPLVSGNNNLRFEFYDGAGNSANASAAIIVENSGHIDPATGIYFELPVGAYRADRAASIVTQNPLELVDTNWLAGQAPYSIAGFTDKSFLIIFDSAQTAAPLTADKISLNLPAKIALKMPKQTDSNKKINPVVWDQANQQWLAHTAKRLTPEEFGELKVPTSAFGLTEDEELVYFETPVLGLFAMMTFETTERPGIRLVNAEDFYAVGQNAVWFTVNGNYLRLENTKMLLNGATLNQTYNLPMDKYLDNYAVQSLGEVQTAGALISYDPERNLFVVTANGFQEGGNKFEVIAENLVHTSYAAFNLEVNTGKLEVREIYAYPNPARELSEQMVRFSCILSKPADINIRIYTNQGRLVQELEHSGQVGFNAVPWNGKDRFDNQTANGMYLYVITIDDGDDKIIQRKKVGILL